MHFSNFNTFTCLSQFSWFQNINRGGKLTFFTDFASFFKFLTDCYWSEFILLNISQISEKTIFINKLSVFCELFLNNCWHCVSKSCSVNIPQMRMFYSFYWGWSWCWVEESQLTKSFSGENSSFCFAIDLYGEFTFMENKKWACIIILFHQILSFVDLTHLKFFKESLLKLSVFDKTWKCKMRFQTF